MHMTNTNQYFNNFRSLIKELEKLVEDMVIMIEKESLPVQDVHLNASAYLETFKKLLVMIEEGKLVFQGQSLEDVNKMMSDAFMGFCKEIENRMSA